VAPLLSALASDLYANQKILSAEKKLTFELCIRLDFHARQVVDCGSANGGEVELTLIHEQGTFLRTFGRMARWGPKP
jgi:hypothetical protein